MDARRGFNSRGVVNVRARVFFEVRRIVAEGLNDCSVGSENLFGAGMMGGSGCEGFVRLGYFEHLLVGQVLELFP